MTDAGKFERLATSVLRIADPLYQKIVHSGVNTSGQTIVDPLDGISICETSDGKRYALACEHTITARSSLTGKWLDPLEGDLIKAIKKLKSFQKENPDSFLRVVLTSKSSPSSDLVQKAHSEAARNLVELDIWSSDRLSSVLDIDPDGQFIRLKFFSTHQTRLSHDLAVEISQKQLGRYAPLVSSDQLVTRDVRAACPGLEAMSSPVVFLNGNSGSGKSAFCHQFCSTLVNDGGLAFVVSHSALERSSSMAQAIRESLVGEVPSLVLDDPVNDLVRISQGQEVQIWIEDINSSASPTDLIYKVDRSAKELGGSDSVRHANTLKILCPLWPENLRALPSELNKVVQTRTVDLLDFSDEEAREAIKKRSSAFDFELTNVEADDVREHLGNDPLLIGLWTGQELGNEGEVLASYVTDALTEVSRSQSSSVFSIRRSAISIAAWMLENRTNEPSFDMLVAEFGSSEVFSHLEAISNAGRLFREVIQDGQSKLGFRHDRVRDYLLTEAISSVLSAGHYSRGYLADPYYTELVARAAVQTNTSEDFWDFAKINIPLVCFSALKHSQGGNPSAIKRLSTICEELVDGGVLQDVHEKVRREIEWQIAGLRGPQFVQLIEAIRANTHAGREARVLNGNVEAAANLCFNAEPYTNAPFRDRLLAHARERHGEKWLENIAMLVSDTTGTTKQNEAALYLAGECADERLAGAVAEYWRFAKDRGDELSHGMLFAAVSCLSGYDEETLFDVFTAWEALPTEDPEGKDESGLSDKRYYVAKYCLSGGLRRVKSDRTLKPLIQLAQSNDDMGHVVYGCLEGVDHPLAAVFVASRIAEIDKRVEGDDDKFNFLASSRFSLFGSDIEHHVRYSEPALRTLRAEWENTENGPFFRKRCFQLWRASISVKHLQRLAETPPEGLEEELLFTRCRLGDVTAIADLWKKIEQGSSGNIYWFQLIRHFDSHYFEDLILKSLEESASAIKSGEKPDYSADAVITDILADRRDKFAINTIIEHWEHLQHRYNYPHVLLSIAAPQALSLHAQHFESLEDKTEYFKLLGFAYGFRDPNRSGITEVQQLEALEPYLDYFDSHLIDQLWDECNDKGFDDWRVTHLDGRLSEESWAFKQINDEAAFRELDDELAKRSDIEMTAYSWSRIRRYSSIPPRTLINRAVHYAESRASNEAVEFLAELLAMVGTRSDLQILSKPFFSGTLTKKQVEGTTFAVRKRSLV